MITIGVDFHKNTSTFSVINPDGQIQKSHKMSNDPKRIQQFLDDLSGPKQLAMEATRGWDLFYETAKDHVDYFYLGHPKKMKAITHNETKHDRYDAEMIAQLTRTDFLPQAYVTQSSMRQLRYLLRTRHHLMNQRRGVRNQVSILIDRNIWPCERPGNFKNLFCQRGLKWLADVSLPERERFNLDRFLEMFEFLSNQITTLESYIHQQDYDLPDLKWLRTVPGFKTSRVNAYIVLTEIADIKRFRRSESLAHYAGLIPREYSSGDKKRNGRIIKHANKQLRTALIESTLAAIRSDKKLKAYYKSVKERRNSGAAIIATARKLTKVIYQVLKQKNVFHSSCL